MNRSTSRSVLAGLVVVGGLALVGCGSGQISQTADQRPTVDGSMAQVGQLAIRDAALEYPNEGQYAKGTTARLRMVIINSGTSGDTLTGVSSPAASGVTITDNSATVAPATPSGTSSDPAGASPSDSTSPSDTGSASPSDSATPTQSPTPTETTAADAQIPIPANGYVSFAGDGASVQLTGLINRLYPAQNLQLTLTFQRAGSVTLTIAVGTPEGEIAPAPTVSTGPDSESEG